MSAALDGGLDAEDAQAGDWGLEDIAIAVLLSAMVVITVASVASRYLLPQLQIAYMDQLLPNLLVWLAMLGTASAARRGGHLGMTALVDRLPPAGRKAGAAFTAVSAVLFLAAIAWQGWVVLEGQIALGSMSAFGYPAWVVSAAIPVGALLAAVRIVQAAVEAWRKAER